MDIHAMIRELNEQKAKLDRTIAALEALGSAPTPKRRGRKSMGEEERQQVAERMRRYWAKRHKTA